MINKRKNNDNVIMNTLASIPPKAAWTRKGLAMVPLTRSNLELMAYAGVFWLRGS